MRLLSMKRFADRLEAALKRQSKNTGCDFSLAQLEPRLLMSATAVISEFMAINDTTIQDEDGEFEDWIEIHNPGSDPLNLEGWTLTDATLNKTKWEFPDVELAGGDYLVVFACL